MRNQSLDKIFEHSVDLTLLVSCNLRDYLKNATRNLPSDKVVMLLEETGQRDLHLIGDHISYHKSQKLLGIQQGLSVEIVRKTEGSNCESGTRFWNIEKGR